MAARLAFCLGTLALASAAEPPAPSPPTHFSLYDEGDWTTAYVSGTYQSLWDAKKETWLMGMNITVTDPDMYGEETDNQFYMKFNFIVGADGCTGNSGVNIDYSAEIKLPDDVYSVLQGAHSTDVFHDLPTNCANPIVFSQSDLKVETINPKFSITSLTQGLSKSETDLFANMTNMLQYSGTDLMLEFRNIRATNGLTDKAPGLQFGLNTEVSILSSTNSKLCTGQKEFCCSKFLGNTSKDEPAYNNNACCFTPGRKLPAVGLPGFVPFVSERCDANLGEHTYCDQTVHDRDSCPECSDPHKKCPCSKQQKENFISTCYMLKQAIYQASSVPKTPPAPTPNSSKPNAPVCTVPHVDIHYDDGPWSVFAALHDQSVEAGQPTPADVDLSITPPEFLVGVVKDPCDNIFNKFYRKVGKWGVIATLAGIFTLLLLISVVICYFCKKKTAGDAVKVTGTGSINDSLYANEAGARMSGGTHNFRDIAE